MKLGDSHLDDTDRQILDALQEDCKASLAQVGKQVGLSAPSVMERIRKLEQAGVIQGYRAVIDSRMVGLDITAFIGLTVTSDGIEHFEDQIVDLPDIMECHHVTGAHTLLIKAKTANTQTLEGLISRLRLIEGVARTETLIVLSTQRERGRIPLDEVAQEEPTHKRRGGARSRARS